MRETYPQDERLIIFFLENQINGNLFMSTVTFFACSSFFFWSFTKTCRKI